MDKIETVQLILRPFTEGDYNDLYEFLFQRRGYAAEALPAVLARGFENGRS